ncbi:hypothetical protein ACFOEM_13970 [Paenalcaligenes hominis]
MTTPEQWFTKDAHLIDVLRSNFYIPPKPLPKANAHTGVIACTGV